MPTPYLEPVQQSHFPVIAFSHKGLIRPNNEDSYLISAFQAADAQRSNVLLAAVADGVGGHKAGEIASRIAVETIHAVIAGCANLDDPAGLLVQAFQAANQQIVQQAQTHGEWNGMGSTCVCALIIDQRLYTANLGDSRLYLIREKEILQLTYDHTWMAEVLATEMPEWGTVDRRHPLAHVLNRYLGSSEPIQVDLRMRSATPAGEEQETAQIGFELEAGDILALASDGVSDLLTDAEIKASLTGRRRERWARRLIYCALKNGGHDNATAVVIQAAGAA
jgi:serine/threonine protein phosphatase PrpC